MLKTLCTGLAVSALLQVPILAQADESHLTLQQLRKRLNQTHEKWEAEHTSVSDLSTSEKQNLCGVELSALQATMHFRRPREQEEILKRRPTTRIPDRFDWRNANGTDFASPILNQAHCGSCVAFAAIGTLETQLNISRQTPYSPWELSPQFLFSCGGGTCNKGWTGEAAAQFLQKVGVTDDSCFPYSSGATGQDLACHDACPNAQQRLTRISGYARPTKGALSLTAVAEALRSGPLMTQMVVYEDFTFYRRGVYRHVAGKVLGGHMISIVGYDSDEQAWIVRNSWGQSWGEDGYFRIAWDDTSGLAESTWLFEVPKSPQYVNLGSLRDFTVVRGTLPITVQSTYSGSDRAEWQLQDVHGTPLFWGQVSSTGAAESLRSENYPDGIYQVAPLVHTRSGVVQGETRIIYILNGTLRGGIQFANLHDGQTLTGPTKLKIVSHVTPVPLTHLVIAVANLDTGEIVKTISDTSWPEMEIKWSLERIPDGNYELQILGQAGNVSSLRSRPIRIRVRKTDAKKLAS